MSKIKIRPYYILKWLIVALAAGNLIFLFVFHYRLPSFLRPTSTEEMQAEQPVPEAEVSQEQVASLQIQIPEEALTYDGTDTLDLMNGVSVLDASGEVQTDINVFSNIKAGSSRKEKIVEYSVTDSEGNRITAERTLTLSDNYTGPSIEVFGEMPSLSAEDLPILVSLLINDSLIYADDGFGADITASVAASVKSDADESGNTVVTLSITNMVNDSYSTDVIVHTGSSSGPTLKLITNSDILEIGEEFNFYRYIEYARDKDGNDISHRIRVDGNVNTSEPGQYTLECYCTDNEGVSSPIQILTITVR